MSGPENTPYGTFLLKRLNTKFQTSPAWRDLFEAVSNVIRHRVTGPRTQLQNVRDPRIYHRGDYVEDDTGERVIINGVVQGANGGPDIIHCQTVGTTAPRQFSVATNLKESAVLQANARLHGFSFFSDQLTAADYARLNDWIEHYWVEGGTENFVRFIGFIKNMLLDVEQLWADEVPGTQAAYDASVIPDGNGVLPVPAQESETDFYPRLDPYNGEAALWNSGVAYPTSHVQISYDLVLHQENGIVMDPVEIFHLFYYLAPIHLVLQRIVADIVGPPIIIHRKPKVLIGYHTSSFLNLDDSLEQNGVAPPIES
jgi:energy-converting hydrogenase Eha subunit F